MEKERRELERQREQMGYVENERREDEFQLSQEESRALKRVDEGRATPVDILLAALAAIRHSEPQDDERAIGCEVLRLTGRRARRAVPARAPPPLCACASLLPADRPPCPAGSPRCARRGGRARAARAPRRLHAHRRA
eukprot:scaffold31581_cov19-Tisochrysis_lutea.AAC.1